MIDIPSANNVNSWLIIVLRLGVVFTFIMAACFFARDGLSWLREIAFGPSPVAVSATSTPTRTPTATSRITVTPSPTGSVTVTASATGSTTHEVLEGIVTVEAALYVRAGPGSNYQIVSILFKDERVTLLGQNSGWYKITIKRQEQNGDEVIVEGWVVGRYLNVPDETANQVPEVPAP